MVKLSILALNDYTDGAVWDEFEVPDGMSRQDVIDSIMMECAELSLVYTQPEILTKMIGLWCRRNLENWRRIYLALNETYNPIHNYDRYEQWTDTSSGESKGQVAGFNQEDGMADRDRAESAGTGTHDGHIYGNIGVTTSAQMIEGEMDVRQRYNAVDAIVASFKDALCVLVY